MEGAMMRRFVCACCTAVLVLSCAKSDDATVTDTAAGTAAATAPTPAALNLADLAGKWNMRSVPESGADTTPTTYVLTATGDTSGWTIAFPNRRAPVPVHVMSVAGDSVVFHAGPFESVRRRGVQVTTESVARLRDGRIVGTTVAHYRTTGADSVLRLRTEGTKAP
jgi:hypothetical protein